jgi:predicted permease
MRFPSFFRRAFNITDFRPGADRNVREEIGFYLEMRARELMAAGYDREQASRMAAAKFGNREWVAEECEKIEKTNIRRRQRKLLFDSFQRDVRFAFRSFGRQPFFSGLIVVLLALGIAGNTAVFSMINAVFLRPFPYVEADRLVDLDTTAPLWNLEFVSVTYPDFCAWRELNTTFESMGVYTSPSVNMMSEEGARRLQTLRVSHDLSEALKLVPLLGRTFDEEDEIEDGPNVTMILNGFWQEHFGGDRDIIGRTITIDGVIHEIIGVLPDEAAINKQTQLWIPLREDRTRRGSFYLHGIGRLSDGVTIEQSQADLDRIQRGLIETEGAAEEAMPIVTDLRTRRLGDIRTGSFAVWGAVAVLLLIACTNIASLMLAKSEVRRREFGIRAAIGAGRSSIIRQLLTESLILALIGGIIGFLFGIWSISAIETSFPLDLPPWTNLNADLGVAGFSFAICITTALFFGLIPAMQSTRGRTSSLLDENGNRSSGGTGTRRLMRAFVSLEVALALGLLVTAALLVQTYRNLGGIDPGFEPEGVLAFMVDLPETDYPDPRSMHMFHLSLIERLRNLPGVVSAASANVAPLRGHSGRFFVPDDAPPRKEGESVSVTNTHFITPDYAETVGLRLKAGRFLTEEDVLAVVVNESYVRYHWGEEDPIGRYIIRSGSTQPKIEVIGVTCDVKHYGLAAELRPAIYLRMALGVERNPYFLMKTNIDPASLASAAREAVSELDPALPIYDMETMWETLDDSLSFREAYSILIGLFALVSLILALGGVYGVISYVVSHRRNEIGIRIALGARRGTVVGMVLRQGIGMVVVGCGLGIGLILLLAGALSDLMYGKGVTDPLTIAGVTAVLLLVALPANLIPAWRAAKADPTSALRAD